MPKPGDLPFGLCVVDRNLDGGIKRCRRLSAATQSDIAPAQRLERPRVAVIHRNGRRCIGDGSRKTPLHEVRNRGG